MTEGIVEIPLLPENVYACLAQHLPWFQWLDGANSKKEDECRSIWVWNPSEICVPLDWKQNQEAPWKWDRKIHRCANPFPYIQQRLKAKKSSGSSYSGWYGLAGYELGVSLLTLPSDHQWKRKTRNDFWFGHYKNILCYDHGLKKYFLTVENEKERNFFFSFLQDDKKLSEFSPLHFSLSPTEDPIHYGNQISRIQDEIVRGNVYQVNYTTRFQSYTDRSPQAIFQILRKKSPVPYAALWNTGECFVLSLSPELFLKGQGRAVVSCPIKGTVERSENPEEDAMRKRQLLASVKDRAELLMIVDLVRNDLGSVCVPGSIQVPELFKVETYSTVHHLVATVSGKLAADQDWVTAFCALFPAGSILGAPKIAAAQWVNVLEKEDRRFYTGAMGYFLESGKCLFNVAIRTFTLEKGLFTAYSGGGIVIDSNAEAEYQELCAKIRYLFF
jgi:para-aminobenzoate synthetase component 1